MADDAADVLVGRVLRPHGLRGDVTLEPETDFPERFERGARFVMAPRRGGPRSVLEIADARLHSGRLLVRFVGVDTVEAAERLRDAELYVPESELRRPEGWVYGFEVVGLSAEAKDGGVLGRVTGMVHVAGRPLLVLETPKGEREVPFVAPLVTSVDLESRRVVLDLPEGLLD